MSDEESSDDLLRQLRIERGQRDEIGPRLRWQWVVAIIIAIVIIAGGVAFVLRARRLSRA